jgi:uncharacterized Tic20 family protein
MKKIFVPGLVAGIAGLAANWAIGFLFMFIFPSMNSEYANEQIFRPWTDPLMNLYYIYFFLLAFGLAWAWEKSKSLFTKNYVADALNFTLVYWLISIIPGMLMTISSFKVSVIMVSSWTIGALAQLFVISLILMKMNKK